MSKSKTGVYEILCYQCTNCGRYYNSLKVPKGKKVTSYLANLHCYHCGIKGEIKKDLSAE